MKKNHLLLITFLILAAATAWYLSNKKEINKKSTLTAERNFAVKDESSIHKIFLGKRNGETYTFTRGEEKFWRVNGKYNVNPNVMEGLLEAITNVTMKYLPPQAAIPKVVKDLAAKGIKVEVYGKNDQLLKAYYVGTIGSDGESTYFIMENSDQPVACEIPQMVGHVGTRYDISGDDWRDKTVFAYKPEEIQAVSIEYPKQRNKSFKLERKGDGFELKPFYENVKPINRKIVDGKVEGYFVNFERLYAESITNGYSKKDSIRSTIPFSVVSVTNTQGETKIAAFYPTYKIKSAGIRASDKIERYFADMSTGDWMLVQHFSFQKIFWGYEAFFDSPASGLRD